MRIVHVFRAPLGGLFRHVVDLTRGQTAAGHQVGILCDSTTGNARDAELLRRLDGELALGVRQVAMARQPGLSDMRAMRAVRRLRAELKPDILHGHGAKGGAFARLPGLIERSWPVTCYTPHGGSFHYLPGTTKHRVYMTAERLLAGRTGAFLIESEHIARRVRQELGAIGTPVRVVHNGISDAEFKPLERNTEPVDLLYIGELRFMKGIDTLLEALARLKATGLEPSLRIQGSGPDEAELRARVAELELGNVSFHPAGPIREALAATRIMIVPSRAESLPYVVLEAAAAKQPLICTDVGGIPEIFGPYADRLIPSSDVGALEGALRSMLAKTPEQRAAEAELLFNRVQIQFSARTMVDGVMAAYREALAPSG